MYILLNIKNYSMKVKICYRNDNTQIMRDVYYKLFFINMEKN